MGTTEGVQYSRTCKARVCPQGVAAAVRSAVDPSLAGSPLQSADYVVSVALRFCEPLPVICPVMIGVPLCRQQRISLQRIFCTGQPFTESPNSWLKAAIRQSRLLAPIRSRGRNIAAVAVVRYHSKRLKAWQTSITSILPFNGESV